MGKIPRRRFFKSLGRLTYLFIAVLVLASCASAPSGDPEALAEYNKTNDAAEPTNRAIFGFNQALDAAVIKPVTGGYRAIAPEPVRQGIHNFLNNLRTPVIFFNDILQGQLGRAGTTLARFVINSTVGILGFGDPAADMGLEFHNEDFGQTLAVWTVSEGPYIMLPIFGPSNPRDTVGLIVDFLIDPLNIWASNTDREWITWARAGARGIDLRDQLWDVLEDLEKSSVDFYATIRSTYRQRRADEISNGAGSSERPAPGFSSVFGDDLAISEESGRGSGTTK